MKTALLGDVVFDDNSELTETAAKKLKDSREREREKSRAAMRAGMIIKWRNAGNAPAPTTSLLYTTDLHLLDVVVLFVLFCFCFFASLSRPCFFCFISSSSSISSLFSVCLLCVTAASPFADTHSITFHLLYERILLYITESVW